MSEGKWRVRLTYFKEYGKYCSDGFYETHQEQLYEIFKEVRGLVRAKKVPGMVEGYKPALTLIEVPGHPNDHPRIIVGDRT